MSSLSSGTASWAWPLRRSASTRARVASWRRDSGRVAAVVRSGRSARAGPRHRASASRRVRAAVSGAFVQLRPALADQALEDEQVHVLGGGGEAVAARLRCDRVLAEGSAEAGDEGLERGGGGVRGAVRPDLVDEGLRRRRSACARRAIAVRSARRRGPPRGTSLPWASVAWVTPRILYRTGPLSPVRRGRADLFAPAAPTRPSLRGLRPQTPAIALNALVLKRRTGWGGWAEGVGGSGYGRSNGLVLKRRTG